MMKEIKEDLKTGETYNFMNERLNIVKSVLPKLINSLM